MSIQGTDFTLVTSGAFGRRRRPSAIGMSLAALVVSASSMAMASGDPDGCEPSGDGFPKGAGITYKEKV